MKRSTIEATDENVLSALVTDEAGRRSEVLSLCKILDSIEGNYSIFIDSPWGYGKTFFVKEVALCLKEANSLIADENAQKLKDIGFDQITRTHLPIYFNAWENDYRDEPVLSLIETLVDGFEELVGREKFVPTCGEITRKLLSAVTVKVGEGLSPVTADVNLGDLAGSVSAENVLQDLKRDRNIRELLIELFEKACAERAERIVLFVDELDRCRPLYSIKLLEAIKFVFDLDNLTVVFSTDCKALASAVKACYGESYDGEQYLSRFYDQKLFLPAIASSHRLNMVGDMVQGSVPPRSLVNELIARGDLSFRDQLKFNSILNEHAEHWVDASNLGYAFIRNVLVPLLVHCSIWDPDLYRRFLNGGHEDRMDFWNAYESINEFLCSVALFSNMARRCEVTPSGDPELVFLDGICPELFGEAKTNILGVSAPAEELLGDSLAAFHLDCRSGCSK